MMCQSVLGAEEPFTNKLSRSRRGKATVDLSRWRRRGSTFDPEPKRASGSDAGVVKVGAALVTGVGPCLFFGGAARTDLGSGRR
jgi:hypothetical protein